MASRDLKVTLIGSDQTGRAFGSASNNADGLSTKFANLGKAAAIGLAGMAVAAGAFAMNGVDAFARVEDAIGAAGVQFGGATSDVVAFASKASTAFGLSKGAALDAANTFGTMGKSAGLTGSDLAKFSTDFTGLAGDMASFKGTSPEQAIEAIGAALRGETEPIRAYGVLLDDASMRQEALALGLIKTTKDALTPQQKVLAAQSLIYKQTADAQGDFQRTSDSTANTAKRLAAETENASARLGEQLAPAVTWAREAFLKLIKSLSGLVEYIGPGVSKLMTAFSAFWAALREGDVTSDGLVGAFERVGDTLHRVGSAIASVVDYALPKLQDLWSVFNSKVLPVLEDIGGFITGTMVPALQKLGGFIADHKTLFESLAVGVGAAFAAFKIYQAGLAIWAAVTKGYAAVQAALNVVMAANPIGIIVLAIAALVAGLIYAYKNSETFRDIVDGAFTAVKKGVGNAIGFMIDGFRMLLTVWLTVADGIISGAATALGWIPGLGDKLKAANTAFDNMKDGILETLDEAAQKAYGFGEKSGSNAAKGLDSTKQGAFNAGKQVGDDMGRGVGAGSGTAYDAGYSVGANAGQGLINGIKSKELAVARQAQILAITAGRAMQTGLQVHSPSRLTMWMGQMLGQGLIDGMASMRPAVTAEMLRMADTQALGSLTARGPAGAGGIPAAAGAVAAQSSAPQVHIDNYNEARQSPYEIAEGLTWIGKGR